MDANFKISPLRKLAKAATKLKVKPILSKVYNDRSLKSEVVDLNTQSQLYDKGVDKNGRSLGEYSMVTKEFWKPLAASQGRDGRTDHITLKDTGAFYASFRFVKKSDEFVISANTLKADTDLVKAYGDILGLTDESKGEIIPHVRDGMLEIVRQKLRA